MRYILSCLSWLYSLWIINYTLEILFNETVCSDAIITLFLERFRPNTRELWCYNAVVADARLPSATDMQSRCSILSPELALPTGSRALTTRSHAALHILGSVVI